MKDFIIKLLFQHKNGQIYSGEKNLLTNIYTIFITDTEIITMNLNYDSNAKKFKKMGFEYVGTYSEINSTVH